VLSDVERQIFDRDLWPHAASVLRTAKLLLHDPTAAEDLAQETFLKAVRSIRQFKEGTDARAWLLTILRNARVDFLRKTNRDPKSASLDASDVGAIADGAFGVSEPTGTRSAAEMLDEFSDDDVIAALRSLPEEIRWTLMLADVEGLDHKEVAAILDVPVGTIKSRAHRGRAMLRVALLPVAIDRRLAQPAATHPE
jgi:RNA polymerase sigma-70 factor (ECF subfamily)